MKLITCKGCGCQFEGVPQRRKCDRCKKEYRVTWAREKYRTSVRHRDSARQHAKNHHIKYRDQVIDRMRERARKGHLERKLEALKKYGPYCVCCGESRYQFLTFDHSLKDGKAHREALGVGGGAAFIKALKKLGFPDVPGLRVLCANCHMAIDLWGSCPHQEGVTHAKCR